MKLTTDFYEYISHFHEGMSQAIQTGTINETHLFALYLVSHIYWNRDIGLEELTSEWHIYLEGFLMVLARLTSEANATNSKFPSRDIWRFLLSLYRRAWFNRASLDGLAEKLHYLPLSMHLLDNQLTRGGSNLETSVKIAGYSGPYFLFLYWDTLDIIHSLIAAFSLSYGTRYFGLGFVRQDLALVEILDGIRSRTNSFTRLHRLEKEYEVTLRNVETNILDEYRVTH